MPEVTESVTSLDCHSSSNSEGLETTVRSTEATEVSCQCNFARCKPEAEESFGVSGNNSAESEEEMSKDSEGSKGKKPTESERAVRKDGSAGKVVKCKCVKCEKERKKADVSKGNKEKKEKACEKGRGTAEGGKAKKTGTKCEKVKEKGCSSGKEPSKCDKPARLGVARYKRDRGIVQVEVLRKAKP